MTYVPQNRANLVAAAAEAARQRPRRRRLPWSRLTRRTLALIAVGTLVPAGGAVYAVVRIAIPPDHVAHPLGGGPDRAPLAQTAPGLLRAYRALAAPPATERESEDLRRWATHSRSFGLDPAAARVLARIDGKRLWLVPGNGYACLALQEPDGLITAGCATEAVARRDGMQANDRQAIYGVLPDGVDRIEVTDDRDGYRHVEPVEDNAYVLKNASATIRYPVGAAQQETFRVIGSTG